jgi:hypothetical protein
LKICQQNYDKFSRDLSGGYGKRIFVKWLKYSVLFAVLSNAAWKNYDSGMERKISR